MLPPFHSYWRNDSNESSLYVITSNGEGAALKEWPRSPMELVESPSSKFKSLKIGSSGTECVTLLVWNVSVETDVVTSLYQSLDHITSSSRIIAHSYMGIWLWMLRLCWSIASLSVCSAIATALTTSKARAGQRNENILRNPQACDSNRTIDVVIVNGTINKNILLDGQCESVDVTIDVEWISFRESWICKGCKYLSKVAIHRTRATKNNNSAFHPSRTNRVAVKTFHACSVAYTSTIL
jgi:hypothetical protein